MSKFYGTVVGAPRTKATRCGSSDIRVSAQSWNGSVITRLWYNTGGRPCVDIETDEGSSVCGKLIFSGTFDEFREKLAG